MKTKFHKRYLKQSNQLGWFVLDNISNNNRALEELACLISFGPEKKELRCVGLMMNLAVKAFSFESYPLDFNKKLEEEKLEMCKPKLWKKRGLVG